MHSAAKHARKKIKQLERDYSAEIETRKKAESVIVDLNKNFNEKKADQEICIKNLEEEKRKLNETVIELNSKVSVLSITKQSNVSGCVLSYFKREGYRRTFSFII